MIAVMKETDYMKRRPGQKAHHSVLGKVRLHAHLRVAHEEEGDRKSSQQGGTLPDCLAPGSPWTLLPPTQAMYHHICGHHYLVRDWGRRLRAGEARN